MSQLAKLYEVHPTQIKQWEQKLKDSLPGIFTDKRKKDESQDTIDELHRLLGKRDQELEWLKKKMLDAGYG